MATLSLQVLIHTFSARAVSLSVKKDIPRKSQVLVCYYAT